MDVVTTCGRELLSHIRIIRGRARSLLILPLSQNSSLNNRCDAFASSLLC